MRVFRSRWIIALISFLFGSTLFAFIGLQIFLAAGQTNLLMEAERSAEHLNVYRNAPDKLEELLLVEIGCGLKYAKEVQTHMWGFGGEQNSIMIKEIEGIVSNVGASCFDK